MLDEVGIIPLTSGRKEVHVPRQSATILQRKPLSFLVACSVGESFIEFSWSPGVETESDGGSR